MIFVIIGLIILLVMIFIKRSDLLAILANNQYARGESDKSLATFAKAARIGNMSMNNRIVYGFLLLKNERIEESGRVLMETSMMTSKKPEKMRIKSMLALVRWKEGDLPLAVEMLEEVHKDFRSLMVYQNLGAMYLLSGQKEKALEYCLEAYDYDSGDMIILDNLAESYFVCGQFDKAREIYDILMSKNPHFPEAYYGYGRLLIEMGEKEAGLEKVRESLDKKFSATNIVTKEEIEKYLLENGEVL